MSDTNPQMEVYCLVTYDRPHEFNNPTHRKNYTCLARNTRFRKFNLFESSNNFLKKITKNLKIIEIKKKKKIQNHLLTLDLPKNYFVLITTNYYSFDAQKNNKRRANSRGISKHRSRYYPFSHLQVLGPDN